MPDLPWRDAVLRVLTASEGPMHYADIAAAIEAQRLREKLGATPARTVNGTITTSMATEGHLSPFVRAGLGHYWLREKSEVSAPSGPGTTVTPPIATTLDDDAAESVETGLIQAFGMFWRREGVVWGAKPVLRGRQLKSSEPVDFSEQRGVYLLHDRGSVVYVGRAIAQPLGVRLRQHTQDRLNGRWERFSWFGLRSISDTGTLGSAPLPSIGTESLVATLEALLIEGLEPPQNRRRGDGFRALEFVQQMDPQAQAGVTR